MGRRVTRTTGSGAYVLADVLRTDQARLRPLTPDGPATTTLRQICRARRIWYATGSLSAISCAPS
jgi:hypothetical protein